MSRPFPFAATLIGPIVLTFALTRGISGEPGIAPTPLAHGAAGAQASGAPTPPADRDSSGVSEPTALAALGLGLSVLLALNKKRARPVNTDSADPPA